MTTMCQDQRTWAKLTPIQSLLTPSIPIGAQARMFPPATPRLMKPKSLAGVSLVAKYWAVGSSCPTRAQRSNWL